MYFLTGTKAKAGTPACIVCFLLLGTYSALGGDYGTICSGNAEAKDMSTVNSSEPGSGRGQEASDNIMLVRTNCQFCSCKC